MSAGRNSVGMAKMYAENVNVEGKRDRLRDFKKRSSFKLLNRHICCSMAPSHGQMAILHAFETTIHYGNMINLQH